MKAFVVDLTNYANYINKNLVIKYSSSSTSKTIYLSLHLALIVRGVAGYSIGTKSIVNMVKPRVE